MPLVARLVTCTHFMILFVGNSDTLAKLTKIRKMQEELTLRHFEIDQMRISQEK